MNIRGKQQITVKWQTELAPAIIPSDNLVKFGVQTATIERSFDPLNERPLC